MKSLIAIASCLIISIGASSQDTNMSSSIDIKDPMSKEGSGTSWLPESTPIYAKMFMRPNGDMLMFHGAITPRFVQVGSYRGDSRFDAPSWGMGMYSHQLDRLSQIGLHLMMSLDPLLEEGYGYPLLFQTGETWHHMKLHDRQHPHDFISELSATYSRRLGSNSSANFYLGYPGEPALGPPAFMHRLIAYDFPDAPIGHHWQDATHITFGVATAGYSFNDQWKIEASSFTGREPNENRYDFDKARFDSASARLSFNPDKNNALQISNGFVKNAEGDGVNQRRITASWLCNKPLSDNSNFSTAFVWGQNTLNGEGRTNSFLLEADYQKGDNTFFSRGELIEKSGDELSISAPLDKNKYQLGALTVGLVHEISHRGGIETGVGFALNANTHPSEIDSIYGSGITTGFQIFLRVRPTRMDQVSMKKESNHDDYKIEVLFDEKQLTPNASHHFSVHITDADNKPIMAAKVKATTNMKMMNMGQKSLELKETEMGVYEGAISFSMQGVWLLNIEITPSNTKSAIHRQYEYNVIR